MSKRSTRNLVEWSHIYLISSARAPASATRIRLSSPSLALVPFLPMAQSHNLAMNYQANNEVAKAASACKATKRTSEDKWEVMYQRLVRYYSVHGHSNVPSRFPDDPALGFWGKSTSSQPSSKPLELTIKFTFIAVSTQRRHFQRLHRSSETGHSPFALHPERKQKLEQLQFKFSAKDPNSLSWDDRFKQLKNFVVRGLFVTLVVSIN